MTLKMPLLMDLHLLTALHCINDRPQAIHGPFCGTPWALS